MARLERQLTLIGRGTGADFDEALSQVVAFQRQRIPLYDRYLDLLDDSLETGLHLPVHAFRLAPLSAFPDRSEAVFVSSGTTASVRSRHYIHRLSVYESSLCANFEQQFGTGPFTIAAYLPGYDEAGGASSLLYMVRCLIRRFGDEESGFFFGRSAELGSVIEWSARYGTRLVLFGVAFGLLDLVDERPFVLPSGSLVIETGGMKTRNREIRRSELHSRLAAGLGVERQQIVSEYGMTELLSQAYTRGGDVFYTPGWMRVEIRNPENPLERQTEGAPGVLAVVDLANMYSVSAILTEDLGEQVGDGFRVLGRLQGAQLRGCNLLLDTLR